jgi:hypothetical protein
MTTKRRKRHTPEQIVRKLRDADTMLNAGKDLAAVFAIAQYWWTPEGENQSASCWA